MANKKSQKTQTSIHHYFIDEGGDSTLFSRKGKVLIGTEGCSRFFMLGLLDVPNPATLQRTLQRAIEFAPDMLRNQSNLPRSRLTNVHLNVSAAIPKKHAGLQAVDYFIWALQRLYERGEDRYVEYLWRAFRLVHDIDDTRKADYGVYYTQKKLLNAAALKWREKNKKPGI